MEKKWTAVISGFGFLIYVMLSFIDGKNNLEFRVISLLKELEGMVEPQVPCYFIFGDSLVDNGNNNHLLTSSKANFAPYGIDFPRGPTGRFTNGRTYVDFLAQLLGFRYLIPPFASSTKESILAGVNYGSGGAGILDMTGQTLGEVLSMDKQLRNHRTSITQIVSMLGSKELAEHHLKQCLYTVGMGNNDYLVNYLSSQYSTSQLYTPDEFAAILVQKLSNQLKTLYKLGARKIGVAEVGLLGCVPAIMGLNGSSCVGFINDYVNLFNRRLGPAIDGLNANLTDAKFILLPSAGNSTIPGVTVTNAPCCNVSPGGECLPNLVTCKNRTNYYFWDGFHPSEQVHKFGAQIVYNAVSTLLIPKGKLGPWRILMNEFFQQWPVATIWICSIVKKLVLLYEDIFT